MKWHDYFEFRDGNLYWKALTSTKTKIGDRAGHLRDKYYLVKLNNKAYYVHRIIWEMHHGAIPEGMVVDHINFNPSDNHIENLQILTPTQNNQRRHKTKGYTKRRNGYQARKTFNNKTYDIGSFGTPGGAYLAHKMFFVNGVDYGK